MHSERGDDYSMINSNIIRRLLDLLKGNSIHKCRTKEQQITKEMWKHIKNIDEATVDNMAKRISSRDSNGVLYRAFTDGKINHGRIFSVYAFTAYWAIEHDDETEAVLRIFDNLYLNALKPWIEKQRVWNHIYATHQRIRGPTALLNCKIL